MRKPGAGRPRNQARQTEGPVDDEIIGAAARLFARQGVAATTMADIAAEVGLGVSSLYYYFRNKNAVLERIVEDVNQVPFGILREVEAAFPTADLQLHAFIRRDAEALCEFPFDINEIHRLAAAEPDTFERYWTDRQLLLRGVTALIESGTADGTFVAVDPQLAALTVLANDEAVQNWFRPPASMVLASAHGVEAADAGTFVAVGPTRTARSHGGCWHEGRTRTGPRPLVGADHGRPIDDDLRSRGQPGRRLPHVRRRRPGRAV